MKIYDKVAYAGGALFACAVLLNLIGLTGTSQTMIFTDILFLIVDAIFFVIAWKRGDKAVMAVSLVAFVCALWMLCS